MTSNRATYEQYENETLPSSSSSSSSRDKQQENQQRVQGSNGYGHVYNETSLLHMTPKRFVERHHYHHHRTLPGGGRSFRMKLPYVILCLVPFLVCQINQSYHLTNIYTDCISGASISDVEEQIMSQRHGDNLVYQVDTEETSSSRDGSGDPAEEVDDDDEDDDEPSNSADYSDNKHPNMCFLTAQFAPSAKQLDTFLPIAEHVPHLVNASNVKFLAYTNLPDLTVPEGWTVLTKDFDGKFKRFITQSRWPKFQAFKDPYIQENCEVVFYHDGAVTPIAKLGKYEKLARRLLKSEVGFAQKVHVKRMTAGGINDEFKAIEKQYKDTRLNLLRTKVWLRKQPDYNPNCTVYENNFFAYSMNSTRFFEAADFLWNHYSKGR
jgi:hypothetical protein